MKNVPTVYLGNRELHRRHSVMIEGGKIPRAKVMDQCMIDCYLMRGLLTLGQHRAGEHVLEQAANAGLWATGVDLSAISGAAPKKTYIPFGMFPLARTLSMISEEHTPYHADVVQRVVCRDWDVSDDEWKLTCLREGLDVVDRRSLRSRANAVRRLRQAVQKTAGLSEGSGRRCVRLSS